MPTLTQPHRPQVFDFSQLKSSPTVFSIINPKGGAQKSSVVANLGAALSKIGYHVLLVDLDEQGSLKKFCLAHRTDGKPSKAEPRFHILNIAEDDLVSVKAAVVPTSFGDFLGPHNQMLEALPMGLLAGKDTLNNFRTRLKEAPYDFILIDTPGRQGAEIRMAGKPADAIIMPVSPACSTHEPLPFLELIAKENNTPIVVWPTGFGNNQTHHDDLSSVYEIPCDGFLPAIPYYKDMHTVFDLNLDPVNNRSGAGRAFAEAAAEVSCGKS